MNEPTVMIEIPRNLFQKLKLRAEFMHRPVEDLVAQTLDAVTPPATDLPPELIAELEAMHDHSDEALWVAAKPSLSPADESRLRQLNHLAGERDLSLAEDRELDRLLEAYQFAVLRRARAFAILRLRGFPIPSDQKLPLDLDRTASAA